MKKIIYTLIAIVAGSLVSYAQDIIVMRNADEIQAKVQTIGYKDITYKKWDFQDGPSYQIAQSDVLYIKYEHGRKELFYNRQKSESTDNNDQPIVINKYNNRPLFNMYIEGGELFSTLEAGPHVHFTFGARCSDIFYLGLTGGIEALFMTDGSDDFDVASVPIMVNARSFIPVNNKIFPFLELSIGPDFITDFVPGYYYQGLYYQNQVLTALRFRAGVGLEYKRFTFGIGPDMFYLSRTNNSIMMGYIKIGVKIGKVN